MTRAHAIQILPLIRAFAEGKTIEIKEFEKWRIIEEPRFDASIENIVSNQNLN